MTIKLPDDIYRFMTISNRVARKRQLNCSMSWRYSTSSAQRDNCGGRECREAKLKFLKSKLESMSNERQNNWSSLMADTRLSRNALTSVEHRPLWKRSCSGESEGFVSKVKGVYGLPEDSTRDMKRIEMKNPPNSKNGKPLTSSSTGNGTPDKSANQPNFEKKAENSLKFSGSSSPNNLKNIRLADNSLKLSSKRFPNNFTFSATKKLGEEKEEKLTTIMTRGTSTTRTVPAVKPSSKREDYGIEKSVSQNGRKGEMLQKEIQTDGNDFALSDYTGYNDCKVRSKVWSSSADKYFSGYSFAKFSNWTGSTTENKRETSSVVRMNSSENGKFSYREDANAPKTLDSLRNSHLIVTKPPSLLKTVPSPQVKENDKKIYTRKSPPSGKLVWTDTSKMDPGKSELALNNAESTLRCKVSGKDDANQVYKVSNGQPPRVTIDQCPEIIKVINDVSSASESSEEESSSDEEAKDQCAHGAISVKKSVTNFLQNIPNSPAQSPSKSNLCQRLNSFPSQNFTFKRVESGEKAWWLESGDKVPETITKPITGRTMFAQADQGLGSSSSTNFLSPPYFANRQISVGEDQQLATSFENHSPRDGSPKRQEELTCLHPDSYYLMKYNNLGGSDERKCLGDFPRECSASIYTQKLQNGLGSPLEDKNLLEPIEMSEMISKAKAGLSKLKTTIDVSKSSSREMSPKIVDPKSEIDLYWKELANSVNRPLLLCDLDFTDLNTDDETDIIGNLKINGRVPPPPPMLNISDQGKNSKVPEPPAAFPHMPTKSWRSPASPSVSQLVKNKKTVKLFWKEVKDDCLPIKLNVVDGENLIWDELTAVKVDTQALEHLFESRTKDLISKKQQDQNKNKEIIVLDPKRSNAINIGMTKLPPPRAIKTAIMRMDSTVVNKEGIEKVLTMLPTEEEKVRIQEAQNANPDIPLGSAEQFLLTLASISQLEARLRLWTFKLNFENSEKEICEPLMDLKQGIEILRVNKTFRAILSTLLAVGNFLNGYDVKGFQIEYLSKVPEVKDTVHKHSLLHHLTIIVMEKFPDSSDLYSEIGPVTRASKVDFDELASNIKKLEDDCKLSWNHLKIIAKHEGHTTMKAKMSDFLADCAERIIVLEVIHKRIITRFQKFVYWLGIPLARISAITPNEIFKIISEFALEYRTTRDRVLQQIKKLNREKTRARGCTNNDMNDVALKRLNSKEAKDDAMLKQLLAEESTFADTMYNTTRRRQRRDTRNLLQEANQNEQEIIETLIKTANQIPTSRLKLKERRRNRAFGKFCKSSIWKKVTNFFINLKKLII